MILRIGSLGPEVLNLERVINALGYSGFEIDGTYDQKTANVIKDIQENHGLDADGICGPKTFALIDQLYEPDKPNFSSSNFLTTHQVQHVVADQIPSPVAGVHPLLAQKAQQMIALAAGEGYKIRVSQGLRTWEAQDKLFAQGRRGIKGEKIVTNARGGQSYHNYGIAVDFVFIVINKKTGKEEVSWDERLYKHLGRWAKEVGLEWGGNWHFTDLPHVQLPNMTSIKALRETYLEAGGGFKGIHAVWQKFVG